MRCGGGGGEESEEDGGDDNANDDKKETLFTEDVADGTNDGEPWLVWLR